MCYFRTFNCFSVPLALFFGVAMGFLVFFSGPSSAEMKKLEKTEMSQVNGSGGLGIQLDLDFGSYGDAGLGYIEIGDSDDGGWLTIAEIFGTFSPANAGDNTIYLDANSNVIQFSAPNPFSGIDVTIDEIGLASSKGSTPDNLGAVTLADDDGDADGSYTDGTASFDLHNTKLKIF